MVEEGMKKGINVWKESIWENEGEGIDSLQGQSLSHLKNKQTKNYHCFYHLQWQPTFCLRLSKRESFPITAFSLVLNTLHLAHISETLTHLVIFTRLS